MSTAGIRDVAVRAGVSVGTVSNVLNRPELVSAATRARVLAIIDQLGFVRNESARALRRGRSGTVGLVVLDITNPFFTDIAKGAESVAEAHGTIITLCNSAESADREQRFLGHLEEQRVQGILLSPVTDPSPWVDQVLKRGTPTVLVDRASARPDRCSAAVDDVLGGQLAAEHLLEKQHRLLAFVGGPVSLPQVAERYHGALGVAGSTEGVALQLVQTSTLTVAAGRAAGTEIAGRPLNKRPTGIIAANDLLALGLLQQLTREGLRVPQDIAIVGYDDIDFAEAAVVPLSSIRQPREQLGRAAAELLFEEIDEPAGHQHRHVVFKPELVVRSSSDYQRQRRPTTTGRKPAAATQTAAKLL